MMGVLANGDFDMQDLFKAKKPYSEIEPITSSVKDVQMLEDDVVWLRYTVDKEEIDFNQIAKTQKVIFKLSFVYKFVKS